MTTEILSWMIGGMFWSAEVTMIALVGYLYWKEHAVKPRIRRRIKEIGHER
jgi:hypothetical protein